MGLKVHLNFAYGTTSPGQSLRMVETGSAMDVIKEKHLRRTVAERNVERFSEAAKVYAKSRIGVTELEMGRRLHLRLFETPWTVWSWLIERVPLHSDFCLYLKDVPENFTSHKKSGRL